MVKKTAKKMGKSTRTTSKTRRSTTKTRKQVPWAGWSAVSPKRGVERRTMMKDCGKKCFLGPDMSFPVCPKKTCEISDKGLWAAYVRARQWGKKHSDYKGQSKPSMAQYIYKKTARKAKQMLEDRGYEVGK